MGDLTVGKTGGTSPLPESNRKSKELTKSEKLAKGIISNKKGDIKRDSTLSKRSFSDETQSEDDSVDEFEAKMKAEYKALFRKKGAPSENVSASEDESLSISTSSHEEGLLVESSEEEYERLKSKLNISSETPGLSNVIPRVPIIRGLPNTTPQGKAQQDRIKNYNLNEAKKALPKKPEPKIEAVKPLPPKPVKESPSTSSQRKSKGAINKIKNYISKKWFKK